MITKYLSELFETHGLPCTIEHDWVVPNSDLPAIRGFWYPGESSGQLHIQILIREGLIIEELFGGFGQGDQGLRDGFTNFMLNDFHVLLAALWGRHDPEQVETEDWEIQGQHYTAYIGNYGIRRGDSDPLQPPSDLYPRVVETIRQEHLTRDIHWFRLFCGFVHDFTYEALKDNEEWEAGIRCLESVSWPRNEGFYTVRQFIILRERDWQVKLR